MRRSTTIVVLLCTAVGALAVNDHHQRRNLMMLHPHHHGPKWWRHHIEGLDDGKKTSIEVEICNLHRGLAPPPGPPNCSSGSQGSHQQPPVCETHEIQPGACHHGVAASCWSFPSCISKQVYTTSSSCTGPMSSTVTPCTDTFNPVDEGCQYFHCNSTSYYHRQCFQEEGEDEEVKGKNDAIGRLFGSFVNHRTGKDIIDGAGGFGWAKKHIKKDEDRYYRGFERNCTKNFQCHDGPVREYGQCEEAGPISFESLYLKRSLASPFAQCGFLTFTVFEDIWCKGRPVSEFVTKSGSCIGPQRLFGDIWGSVRATCKSGNQLE